jgi:phospholipid transport system transporter-binding protein
VRAAATTAAEPLRLAPAANGRISAQGTLTFATARAARLAGLEVLNAAPALRLQIDCAGVTAADSAGLAVLLDWLAAAKRARCALKFTGLPQDLTALAKISEVEQLLARGV